MGQHQWELPMWRNSMISCDVIPASRGNPFGSNRFWHEPASGSPSIKLEHRGYPHKELASPRDPFTEERKWFKEPSRSRTGKARRSSESGCGNRTATRAATNRDPGVIPMNSTRHPGYDGAGGGNSRSLGNGLFRVLSLPRRSGNRRGRGPDSNRTARQGEEIPGRNPWWKRRSINHAHSSVLANPPSTVQSDTIEVLRILWLITGIEW